MKLVTHYLDTSALWDIFNVASHLTKVSTHQDQMVVVENNGRENRINATEVTVLLFQNK